MTDANAPQRVADPATVERVQALVARATGVPAAAITAERRAGHASSRAYWRARWSQPGTDAAPRSAIVMLVAPDAPSDEIGKGGPTGPAPFVAVQRYLAGIGVRVPGILAWSQDGGYVVLEDLGDDMLVDHTAAPATSEPLYVAALDQLARLRVRADEAPDPTCVAFQRRYDRDLYRWELDHFLDWVVAAWKGAALSAAERALIDHSFDEIAGRLAAEPAGFTHRDYQARNIMVLPGGGQAVIDFQDALLGPRQYDVVSLLRDSYVVLEGDFVGRMVRRYLDATAAAGGPRLEEGAFRAVFDLLTVQRKLKDAGRFVYLDRVKGNPEFLRFVPVALGYVREAFVRLPELATLQAALAHHVPELAHDI